MKRVLESQLLLAMMLSVLSLLVSTVPNSQAAITATGNVSPADPASWTSTTNAYIGNSAPGTVTATGGSSFQCRDAYLGYYSQSQGTVTVADAGSSWLHSDNIYIGYHGNGNLNIGAGGSVKGFYGYLGYQSDSIGTATVTGANSKWTLTDLYVPYYGKGTLTVNDGGMVTVNGGLFASLNSLFGNGIILTNGAVLDIDQVFDANHGLQKTIEFGSGGILTINQNAGGYLGAGYKDKGTLRIADGIVVTSSGGYLGYLSGSTGTTTVTGNGSQWNSARIYIGYFGNGILNIEAGGQVVIYGDSHLGNLPDSIGTATVTGADSKWTTGSLYVGDRGKGTLDIKAGGQVSSYSGSLGFEPGSNGTATITGTGSQWIMTSNLEVGNSGGGTLKIEAGGKVRSGGGVIGNEESSTGTVLITGTGSKWTSSGDMFIGRGGSGQLTVTDGGTVVVSKTLGASLNNLYGNGNISANGAVLDADLVFDAAHGLQNILQFGTGGTLNIIPNADNMLGAGYKGIGTLKIADGKVISSSSGYLGYLSGSAGTATVTGSGSHWINSETLYVGYYGSGTLKIDAGGRVDAASIDLAHVMNTVSTVTVNGIGSQLNSNGQLLVGDYGIAHLRIEAGGQVSDETGYLGNGSTSTGTATVIGAGSRWINNGNLYVGSSNNGTLSIIDGAMVTASSISINGYKSLVAIDVGTGSKLVIDNGNGTINNYGTVRIVAGASVLGNKTYSPISAATWNGGGVQAFGGKWNATDHSFTVSGVQSADSGILLPINLLSTQRVLIDDTASHWILGASFSTNYPSFKFIASAINDGTLDALRKKIGADDVLLGGWNLKVDRNLAGMPVYLSFGDGVGGYSDKNMHVWSYDGTKWSQFDADNLNFDGAYANFITTATGCFAVTVTVPEPGVGVLLGAAILGAVGFYMRKRWRR